MSKDSLVLVEINNLSFGSPYSLEVLSYYYTNIANKKEEKLLIDVSRHK